MSRRSYLLVINGISPKDFLYFDADQKKGPEVKYDKPPEKFVSVARWPKTTNLRCWNCGLIPTDYPKAVVTSFTIAESGKFICNTEGSFGHWPCAVSYILRTYPKHKIPDAIDMLCLLESQFTGVLRRSISAAPDHTKLKEYCGNDGLSESEYVKQIEMVDLGFA